MTGPRPPIGEAFARLRQRPSAAEALAALRGDVPDFADVSGGGSSAAAAPKPGFSEEPLTIRRALGLAGRAGVRTLQGMGSALELSQAINPENIGATALAIRERRMPHGLSDIVGSLGDRAGLPEPQNIGERLAVAGGSAAMAGPMMGFGAASVVPGLASGLSGQGAAEFGGGPVAQTLASVAGGGLAAGVGALRVRPGATIGATKLLERTAAEDETLPGRLLAPKPGEPADVMGTERLGRSGRQLALRIAGQGGETADQLATASEGRVAQESGRRITQERADLAARLAGRGRVQDATAQTAHEIEQARAAGGGDKVASLLEQHAGLPPGVTLWRAAAAAEADLKATGDQVYGALRKQNAVLPPHESTAPIYDALGDPLVRDTYMARVGRDVGEHTPDFDALQKTYQSLGVRVRQAALNGGELPNGTSMGDLRTARQTLGDAMEKVIPGFKEANATYKAKADFLESQLEGYADAPKAIPLDITDKLTAKGAIAAEGSPSSADGYRFGLVRRLADQLREAPITRDAASPLEGLGSHDAQRLRLAFPDEASYQKFLGQVKGMSAGVDAATTRGATSVEAVRRAEVRSALGRRQTERAARNTESTKLAKEVIARSRGLGAEPGVDASRAGAEVIAGMKGAPIRDAILAVVRKFQRGDIPYEVRKELTPLLTAQGDAAISAQAQRLNEVVQRYMQGRNARLGGAAAGAMTPKDTP